MNQNPGDPINFNPQIKQKVKNMFKDYKKDEKLDDIVRAFENDMA